jgi:hypothetical protein
MNWLVKFKSGNQAEVRAKDEKLAAKYATEVVVEHLGDTSSVVAVRPLTRRRKKTAA